MADAPSADPSAAPASAAVIHPAVSAVCGSDVVNNPSVDASASLTSCITQHAAAGATVIQLPAGRYYLNGYVDLGATSNVTIETQGVTSGPACLDSGAAACAVLTAMPTNIDTLVLSTGASNLVFNHIALDGNTGPRHANNTSKTWGPNNAYNARIHTCTGCQFVGFTSTRAVHGTGLEFSGDNAVFSGVYFYENGWGASSYSTGEWSDGLTIWSSANVRITGSKFIDNSDIDLILGNGPSAVIQNNTIGNHKNFAFGALMLDNFNGGFPGNYTGAVISGNTIDCSTGMCGIGLMLGPHFWYQSSPIIGTSASITGNTITTAKQGIFTAGANGFSITNNTINEAGAYAGTNYQGCVAQPLTVSSGDSDTVSGNTYGVYNNLLYLCTDGALDLPGLIIHRANVDYQVALAFRQILGRDVDASGGASYSALYEASGLDAMRTNLANSSEAQTDIDANYLRVLGRHVDPSGKQAYTVNLAAGAITMEQMPVQLMLSTEAVSNPYRSY